MSVGHLDPQPAPSVNHPYLPPVHLQDHVYVTCPLLRVPPGMFLQYEALVWAALDGLRPAEPLRKAADQVEAKLMEQAKAEVSLACRSPASSAVQCMLLVGPSLGDSRQHGGRTCLD